MGAGARLPKLKAHDSTHPVIPLTMGSPSVSTTVDSYGIIDTGSTSYSTMPSKLAHEIDINRYHKVIVYKLKESKLTWMGLLREK
jgi:predicted aspartyl protease